MHHLILVSGPPSTGKSSICSRLSSLTGWAVLDKEELDDSLARLNLIDHADPGSTYQMIFGLAELNLRNRASIILDGIFFGKEVRRQAREIASRWGARFRGIDCKCSDRELWRQRLEQKSLATHGRIVTDYRQRIAAWSGEIPSDHRYEPWPDAHLTLDSARSLQENFSFLLLCLELTSEHASWLC